MRRTDTARTQGPTGIILPQANRKKGVISGATFIFLMILGVVVAGLVIRNFLVPSAKTFEQGALTKSVANLKGAFTAVCEGRSAGQQLQLSVPPKGAFVFYSCKELLDEVAGTLSLINGNPITDPDTIAGLKAKCPTGSLEKHAVLAYGWDNSWDWWFYHSTNVEIKSEILDCGKRVVSRERLGQGDYMRLMRLEHQEDATGGWDEVKVLGG